MATVQETVEVIFGVVDNSADGLFSFEHKLNAVANQAGNITEPLSKIADYALKAETAVLALAAAYGGYAMTKAAEFQTAQIDLNKVLSDADPKIESFTKTVVDLSQQYGVSSAVILQGVANFKQAGFSAAEAAALQKNALDLMIAGDVEAADASQILVSSIKGFGMEASDAARMIEALNNVSNDYATDVQQLADGISRLAPIAHTMGFSFEETTGLLTPLIEIFGSGAEAAEGLKTGLLKLIDDAKPVKEALASIGVSQKEANGELRSGKDIFYDVAKAFEHLDDKQKLFITQQLIGIDQAPRMVLAFDGLAKINAITASAMEKTGSVSKEVNLRLDSAAKQADIAKISFDNLAIVIGQKLNDEFKGVVSGSTSVVQSLKEIVEAGGLDQFFDALRPTVDAFAKTLEDVAKNLPAAFEQVDFSALLASFKDLGLEIGDIFDGLDVSTPEGLAKVIQEMVDTLTSLTRVTSGVVAAWTPLVAELVDGIRAFNDLDGATQKTIGTTSGAAQVFEAFKGLLFSGANAVDTFATALSVIAGLKTAETLVSIGGAVKAIDFAEKAASVVTLAGSFSGLVAPLAAATATIAAVGFAVKENLSAWDDYARRQEIVRTATDNLVSNQQKIKERLLEISQQTGIAVSTMDQLDKAVAAGALRFDEASGKYVKAAGGIRDYDKEVSDAQNNQWKFADAVEEARDKLEALGITVGGTSDYIVKSNDAMVKFSETVNKSGVALKEYSGSGEGAADKLRQMGAVSDDTANAIQRIVDKGHQFKVTIDGANTTVTDMTEAQVKASKSLDKTAESADKAAEAAGKLTERARLAMEQAHDMQKTLETLASNERIKKMEFSANIKIEDIRAQAQQVTAAFEAIGSSVKSTNDLIGGLFAHDAPNWDKFGFDTKEQIEKAGKRADELTESQIELNNAQIRQMDARTESLRSGNNGLTIKGDGLEVELRMFMKKILESIQVEGNLQGLEFLLGH